MVYHYKKPGYSKQEFNRDTARVGMKAHAAGESFNAFLGSIESAKGRAYKRAMKKQPRLGKKGKIIRRKKYNPYQAIESIF